MFANIREKLKGWKTIIWSWFLIVSGVVFGLLVPLLDALNVAQVNAVIPEKFVPFAPLILVAVGEITKRLRQVTTGPVGAKGDEAPAANVKAGD